MKQISQLVVMVGLGLCVAAQSVQAAPGSGDSEKALTKEIAADLERKAKEGSAPRYLIHQPVTTESAPLPRPRPEGLNSLAFGWNGDPARAQAEKERLRSLRMWAQADQSWAVRPAGDEESEIFGDSGLMTALEDITIPVDFTLGGVVLRLETAF